MSLRSALVIAVENYHDTQIDPVVHARRDAEQFAKALELHGFDSSDIEILLDNKATKTAIESKLRRILKRATSDEKVFLFYAGHGFADKGENFLTCADTILSDVVTTSVSLENILKSVRQSESQHVLLFIDACHSGFDIAPGMRNMISTMTAGEFEDFFNDSEYHLAFVSCATDQCSYSSDPLKHGIWSHYIIQALTGEAPSALDRGRYLTGHSLQSYLETEVPRTVRRTYSSTEVQTPRTFGNASGDFILADMKPLLDAKALASNRVLDQLTRVSLLGEKEGRIRSLQGFQKTHHVPDRVSGATERFVASVGEKDLRDYVDSLYAKLKEQFGYKRRAIDSETSESGATIQTNDFTVNIALSQHKDAPSKYIVTTEVTDVREPNAVTTKAFDNVFSSVFNSITFGSDDASAFDVEQVVDAIEAIDDDSRISVQYPANCSECIITLPGSLYYEIVVTSCTFSLRETEGAATKPSELIDGFKQAQLLLSGTHGIGALPM